MLHCKAVATHIAIGTKLSKYDEGSKIDPNFYKRLVGSLILNNNMARYYFVVSLISRYMESHKKSHCKVGKRILRFFTGTIDSVLQLFSFLDMHVICC